MNQRSSFKRPRFCMWDGVELVDREGPLKTSFDIHTGARYDIYGETKLKCPTPGHPFWFWDGGMWMQEDLPDRIYVLEETGR